jgi:hypothetical protein
MRFRRTRDDQLPAEIKNDVALDSPPWESGTAASAQMWQVALYGKLRGVSCITLQLYATTVCPPTAPSRAAVRAGCGLIRRFVYRGAANVAFASTHQYCVRNMLTILAVSNLAKQANERVGCGSHAMSWKELPRWQTQERSTPIQSYLCLP